MGLTFRGEKGSSLTHNELDNNFREFFYSASLSGSSVIFHRSRSLDPTFELPATPPSGKDYYIQFKDGNEPSGSNVQFSGSQNFIYDFRNDHFKVSGSTTLSGSVSILGTASISGDLTIGGKVYAEEFITEKVATSYIYKSGSTKFGDTADDTHAFTGSVEVQGSITGSDVTIDQWGGVSSSLAANYKYSVDTSASLANTITNNSSSAAADLTSTSSSLASTIDSLSGSVSSNYLLNTTDTLTGDLDITGNLVVAGTGSFGVLQSVTGSAKIIGDAYIILNSSTPSQQYAGIKVIDSGSTDTGSLEYDSSNNHWFYESTDEGYASAFLAGPRSTRGTLQTIPKYSVVMGDGGNHFTGSNITDSGSIVTVTGTLAIDGYSDVSASLAALQTDAGLSNIVEDITPQLGGALDLNSNNISGSGTISIAGEISGSGIHSTNTITAADDIIAYASSDIKLKDNITAITNPIGKIKEIGGYEFDWNGKQSTHKGHDVGVIAQEVEKVLPELVTTRDNGYKAVKYDKIVALLIEGIKEQQKQIDELKARL